MSTDLKSSATECDRVGANRVQRVITYYEEGEDTQGGLLREAAATSYVISVAHARGGVGPNFDTGFTANILTGAALWLATVKMPMIAGTRARSVFAASGTHRKPTLSRFRRSLTMDGSQVTADPIGLGGGHLMSRGKHAFSIARI